MIRTFFRRGGVVLGVLILTLSLPDVAGFSPHSGEQPPLLLRLQQNFLPILAAVFLLLPYQRFDRTWVSRTLVLSFAMISGYFVRSALLSVIAFVNGPKTLLGALVSIGIAILIVSNVWIASYTLCRNRSADST
jgi:hypothetical protein